MDVSSFELSFLGLPGSFSFALLSVAVNGGLRICRHLQPIEIRHNAFEKKARLFARETFALHLQERVCHGRADRTQRSGDFRVAAREVLAPGLEKTDIRRVGYRLAVARVILRIV